MTSVWNVACSNCGKDTGVEAEEANFCAYALCDECSQTLEAAANQQRIRWLEATIHRLVAAGDQFAAFDGTQTAETGELWATTRAKFETAKTEAMGTVFATVK